MSGARILVFSHERHPLQALASAGLVTFAVAPKQHLQAVSRDHDLPFSFAQEGAWRGQGVPNWGVDGERLLGGRDLEVLDRRYAEILASIDRINWAGESLSAMERLADQYVEVWAPIISPDTVDGIYFHHPPHFHVQGVVAALAEARGVPMVYGAPTLFRHRMPVYRRLSAPPSSKVISPQPSRVPLELSSYASGGMEQQRTLGAAAVTRSLPEAKRLLTDRGFARRYAASARVSLEFGQEGVPGHLTGPLARQRQAARDARRVRDYARWYASLATSTLPAADRTAVFALHYQPEATTLPMAGHYRNQLRAIKVLRAALPPDVRLVVKEHHQMMRYSAQWARARDAAFLRELAGLVRQGVALLDTRMPATQLLAGVDLVGTSTGSIGWEAMNAGVPVVAFGFPWYSTAPGCLIVEDETGLQGKLVGLMQEDAAHIRSAVGTWLHEDFQRTALVAPVNDGDFDGLDAHLKEAIYDEFAVSIEQLLEK